MSLGGLLRMAGHDEQSLEEIVKGGHSKIIDYYRGQSGKDFKSRVKKFEEFHNPENQVGNILSQHAEDTFMGAAGHEKGAYHQAMDVLYKHAGNDFATIDDMGKLEEIAEKYVDAFLATYMGHDGWHEFLHELEHAGIEKEEIRKLKGSLFAQYTPQREGTVNPLDSTFLKGLKGKKRVEIRNQFKQLTDQAQQGYFSHLVGKASRNLVTDDDRIELGKYVHEKAGEMGYDHEKHPITHEGIELRTALQRMVSGGNLAELGYKKKAEGAAHGHAA